MTEPTNLELIAEVYETFQRGDIAGVLNLLHDDAVLDLEGPASIPWAGNWRGRDGWLQFFQALGQNAERITLQMQPFASQGDRVVAVGRYRT
jgi:hypothetical protein